MRITIFISLLWFRETISPPPFHPRKDPRGTLLVSRGRGTYGLINVDIRYVPLIIERCRRIAHAFRGYSLIVSRECRAEWSFIAHRVVKSGCKICPIHSRAILFLFLRERNSGSISLSVCLRHSLCERTRARGSFHFPSRIVKSRSHRFWENIGRESDTARLG